MTRHFSKIEDTHSHGKEAHEKFSTSFIIHWDNTNDHLLELLELQKDW